MYLGCPFIVLYWFPEECVCLGRVTLVREGASCVYGLRERCVTIVQLVVNCECICALIIYMLICLLNLLVIKIPHTSIWYTSVTCIVSSYHSITYNLHGNI